MGRFELPISVYQATMGFDATTLTSNNAVLPILYYIHHRGIANDLEKASFEADRESIYRWLIKAQLLGSFNGSVEITIALSRMVYQKPLEEPVSLNISTFPDADLSAKLGPNHIEPRIDRIVSDDDVAGIDE